MVKKIILAAALSTLFFTCATFADYQYVYRHSYNTYHPRLYARHYRTFTEHTHYYHHYNNGGTHWVRSYTRRDGTFVQGHLSGNPYSGIRCHDNVCS